MGSLSSSSIHRAKCGNAVNIIDTIERDPARLRAYYGDIERLIARCMDELYLLALKKGCRAKRAALADIEYRARLVLKRDRERLAN